MHPIKEKWLEFVEVIDASADAQLAIVAALVLPTFIVIIGTLLMAGVDPAIPFAPVIEAAGGKLFLVFLGLAALALWRFGALAAYIYQRDRKRLLGR